MHRRKRKGQVLALVAFTLFAMCGMLGLAVDLGWSYFVKKSAQSAADSAALAAAEMTLASVGEEGPWSCGEGMVCQSATPCPESLPASASTNIESGCLYAARNGFRTQGNSGRQQVVMAAGVTTNPPTVPNVKVNYWVTATAAETIPQLFSSLLGNTLGTTSARATAGIVDSMVPGSLILLNRENDCLPIGVNNSLICGVNALVQANNNQGFNAVEAEGGMLLASTKHGTDVDGRFSGESTGGGAVVAPFTYIRGQGYYYVSGGSTWTAPPQNMKPDASYFTDPLRGKGQPPPPTGLTDRPVLNAQLSGSNDPANPAVYLPGNYFATALDNQGRQYATGDPIRLNGYIRFSDGGSGFGGYVFYGGVTNQSAGTVVTFGPGRYFLAGAMPKGNSPSPLCDIRVNMTLRDNTTGYNVPVDAGEIFVFTDTNYHGGPDGTQTLQIPALVQPIASQLKMGMSGFQLGNASSTFINLHGLNRDHPSLPADLKLFTPIVLYQDQANSIVKYTARGYIDTSCGQATCPNTSLASIDSTQLIFQASPSLHLWGVSYQPRGTWTSMVGGGGYDAPLQLITGAINVHANSNVRLRKLDIPLIRTVVALVE